MTNYDKAAEECIDTLDERDVRALEEYLTVTPEIGRARGADDLTLVTSQSGKEYLVDVREGVCECPDSEYRHPDGGCKHVRRARIAMGHETVDARTLAELDVDPRLGEHANGPRVATSDGGVTGAIAGDDAEILESDDVDPWDGPHVEYDKYGEPTGARYYQCRDCSREVHEDIDRDLVTHRDGCRFAEVSDR
ncbi:hypothetical protein [Natrinema halophilum]|uniref:SWIM-type domain-containing protein n=1 Tax=Natrinema halophilum TaxID=1699371 RepID=A0A7D5GT81_9EURY|nr:hypothetical protein [Natrinema halophilum]QLG49106.1 hypothetical protein HYG82_09705 [Natrinema halophilum]